jgi:phosphonate transport system substrate-binding protein
MIKSTPSTASAVVLALFAATCLFFSRANAGATPAAQESQAGVVVLGLMPSVSEAATRELYGPLAHELSQLLGRPVEMRIAKTYQTLGQDLLSGSVHLAPVSSFLYVNTLLAGMRAEKPIEVVVQERRADDNPYVGVFVVKADSSFKSMSDLKGKRMAYVDPQSSSGYYYPRLRLRELGYDPDKFFAATIFAGTHEAVVAKIKAGEADVGTVSEMSAALSKLRVIDRTAVIPGDAIVASAAVSAEDIERVRKFLLGAHQLAALSNFFIAHGLDRYVAPDTTVYTRPGTLAK